MKVVLDPGSTHMGKREYGKELLNIAAGSGADAVKFQLFPKKMTGPNVHLSFDLFKEFYHYGKSLGVDVTASVFGPEELDFLVSFDIPFVKFSYSMRDKLDWIQGCLTRGNFVVVSTDMMKVRELPQDPNLARLFCQPLYPTMTKTRFEGLFPPFDGFSDHSLGIGEVIEAVENGAQWIEKHYTLEYSDVTCPDRQFALNAKQVEKMCLKIKSMT